MKVAALEDDPSRRIAPPVPARLISGSVTLRRRSGLDIQELQQHCANPRIVALGNRSNGLWTRRPLSMARIWSMSKSESRRKFCAA
jgi:hypothetical protein